jgi:hypothetical protein
LRGGGRYFLLRRRYRLLMLLILNVHFKKSFQNAKPGTNRTAVHFAPGLS